MVSQAYYKKWKINIKILLSIVFDTSLHTFSFVIIFFQYRDLSTDFNNIFIIFIFTFESFIYSYEYKIKISILKHNIYESLLFPKPTLISDKLVVCVFMLYTE